MSEWLIKAIFNIYTSRPFQRYKKHLNTRCCDPFNQALNFRESWRTPSSHFWECEFHPHTCLKTGLRHSKFPLLGVWVSSSHLPQNKVATLQVPTFGSVSFILTFTSKWGCDNSSLCCKSHRKKQLGRLCCCLPVCEVYNRLNFNVCKCFCLFNILQYVHI